LGVLILKFCIGNLIHIIQLIKTSNHTRFVTDVSQPPQKNLYLNTQ